MFCHYCSAPCNNKYCSLKCVGASLQANYREKYESNPKLCRACSAPLSYDDRRKTFCDKSCAATFNNTGRHRTIESRQRTSLALTKPRIGSWDWSDVQAYYDAGHSTRQCIKHFGMSSGTLFHAKKQGEFITRQPAAFNPETALIEGSTANRSEVKKHLIQSGLLDHRCAECGAEPIWNGKPLVLILDHINGINNDNQLENLRFLCPNCNSQTTTFCRGAGRKRSQIKAKDLVAALKATDSIKDALLSLGMELTGNDYSRVTRLLPAKFT